MATMLDTNYTVMSSCNDVNITKYSLFVLTPKLREIMSTPASVASSIQAAKSE